jgi:hypothetical protein
MAEAWLGTEKAPHDGSDHCDQDDGRHEPAGDGVREALHGGAAALSLADERHDLGQERIFAHALGTHHEAALAVQGAARHASPYPLFHGHGLAGNGRLVHGTPPLDQHSVHRDLLAGANAQVIADLDAIERQVDFRSIVEHAPRRLGSEPE